MLFCDIVDSTPLAEELGPEAWHAVLNDFFDLVLATVHANAGTLNQFLGDGFMALFGAPMAYEDHAMRAAHTALGIRSKVDEQFADAAPAGASLRLRMGLNTGPVIVGKLGDDQRMDYTAVGDTTNVAARLQQVAAAGEVCLGETTWAAIRQHFDCAELGQRRLKGVAQPVAVYRLEDRRGLHAARVYGGTTAKSAPLVGREQEVARIGAALARLMRGRGRVIGIIGEAGIGKSRLLTEARRQIAEDTCWLAGRALSFGQNLSYGPFIEVLRGIAGIADHDGLEESRAKLAQLVGGLFDEESDNAMPFVAMLAGLEPSDEARRVIEGLDARDVRGQMFIAARRLFTSLARLQPLVLEMQDWHWADEASDALLKHLLPLTQSEAMLVFVAGRPDPDTPCSRLRRALSEQYGDGYEELLLAPLSHSEAAQLIGTLSASRRVSARLRGAIVERAEGNPLFIEEVTRSVLAGNKTARDGSAGDENVSLPDNVEAIIMARIDRLEDDVKHVLKLASVIGHSFHSRILSTLDAAEHELDVCLGRLQQLELIREKQVTPELEYVFKHAVVRDASYRSILGDRRRQLHKLVGDAVETLFGERLDEFASFLAYHYARAEMWQKAQAYLVRAGDQAARMAADVDATRHYRAALEACGRAFGEAWDHLEHASLERRIGEALYRLGQHEQALEHLSKALSLLGGRYPSTSIAVRRRILTQMFRQAWHRLRRLPSTGDSRHDANKAEDEELLTIYLALGWVHYFSDHERFFLDVLSGLNWAERRGFSAAVSHGSMGIGVACTVTGLPRLAEYYLNRATKFAADAADAHAIAAACYGAALQKMYRGQWPAAQEKLGEAQARWANMGRLREWGVSAATAVWLLLQRGEFGTAERQLAVLRQTADESGDGELHCYATHLGGAVLMRRGQLSQAGVQLEEAVRLLKQIPDYQILPDACADHARCVLWTRGPEQALQIVDAYDDLERGSQASPDSLLMLRVTEFEAAQELLECAARADMPAARKRARAALRQLRRLERVYLPARSLRLNAQAALEWLEGRHTRARKLWRRALAASEGLGSRLYTAMVLYESGRLQGDAPALRRASKYFDEMGCAFELSRGCRHLAAMLSETGPAESRALVARALELHADMSADAERAKVAEVAQKFDRIGQVTSYQAARQGDP